jgi:trimeric autotransporter adhesin
MKYITPLFASFFCFAAAHSQVIITSAGTGAAGFGGDGGPATAAILASPYGVTLDKDGNLYIGDVGNRRVRKISPAYGGIISTVAGNGTAGYSGDGFEAIYAQIDGVWDIAVDKKGNIFLADAGNNRVRKVSTTGVITTYAGTGAAGYNGDGIAATSAMLNVPHGICVDDTGSVFIADRDNFRLRKIDTLGIITTIAGNGTAGFTADGELADTATLDILSCIRVNKHGEIFFTDNERLRKITSSGKLLTAAGNGMAGSNGDGGPALAAEIDPAAFCLDTAGNIYIAEGSVDKVRKIGVDGVINVFAGTGVGGYSGDGGNPLLAKLNACQGVAAAPNGDVFIGDVANRRIRMVTMSAVATGDFSRTQPEVDVFPNPAHDFLTITLKNTEYAEAEVRIISFDGKMVDHFCLRSNAPATIAAPWPPGVYTVNIAAAGYTISKTLDVQ